MKRFEWRAMLALGLWSVAVVVFAGEDLGPKFDIHDVVTDVAKPGKTDTAAKPTAPSAAGSGVLIDQIVAVVNDEAITRVDLDARTEALYQQLSHQNPNGSLPDRDILRKQVLERMITDHVLTQFGKENGMRVDDVTLDRAVARIAEDNKQSLADFRRTVESQGMLWNAFREDVRNEIMVARLRDREVESRVSVTDGEVEAQLREEAQRGSGEDELLISHVLVLVPEQADPEQISKREARAREVLERLKAGENFAQVAASYSDAPDALQGGSLGWRTLSRVPTVFANLAPDMKKGQISDVIRSGSGFHVFEVIDRRGGKAQEIVRQFHLKEILVRIDANTTDADARLKLRGLRARLEGGEDFGQLARLNSEDESRGRGGDIGWVATGETFPSFEKAMVALQPGQISDIIQTPMGLHLIQLVAVRESDVGEEKRRAAARQGVRVRKTDEAFEDWVRQQRDGAYVEYRNGDRQI